MFACPIRCVANESGAYHNRIAPHIPKMGSEGMTKTSAVPDDEAREKRQERRMTMTRPVQLDRGRGVTRNISTSAVFFETDLEYEPGNKFNFAIELDGPGDKTLMPRGREAIVRVELRGGKLGIAAKIVASKLEAGFETIVQPQAT